MKKFKYAVLIVLLGGCFLFLQREPICIMPEDQEVMVRYESSLGGLQPQTAYFSLSPSEQEAVQEILQKKAWYVGNQCSQLLLGQNYFFQEEKLISIYFGSGSVMISENGVVRDIGRDRYAYFTVWKNREKGKEIYDALYAQLGPRIKLELASLNKD